MIYRQRNEILEAACLDEQITNLRKSTMTDVVRTFVAAGSLQEQWDLPALERVLRDEWQLDVALKAEVEKSDSITDEDIFDKVIGAGAARGRPASHRWLHGAWIPTRTETPSSAGPQKQGAPIGRPFFVQGPSGPR